MYKVSVKTPSGQIIDAKIEYKRVGTAANCARRLLQEYRDGDALIVDRARGKGASGAKRGWKWKFAMGIEDMYWSEEGDR